MFGAIIGDIIGSRFEFDNHRRKEFQLFNRKCFATDDSFMTLAVAKAFLECKGNHEELEEKVIYWMRNIGCKYPNGGYGGMFSNWLYSETPKPYNSYGNGSAMRISPVAYVAKTIEEVKELSHKVTAITHNHPEGIKGAEAVAVAIFMAKKGYKMWEIRDFIHVNYYSMDFTLNSIRNNYEFNETCQKTVPQALVAFFESKNFEDAIRNAISIGGDSDTIGAITGSVAEAYYGVPLKFKNKVKKYLDKHLMEILEEFNKKYIKGEKK